MTRATQQHILKLGTKLISGGKENGHQLNNAHDGTYLPIHAVAEFGQVTSRAIDGLTQPGGDCMMSTLQRI